MDPIIMKVELGKMFHIELESNPSTGYAWFPAYDKGFLDLCGERFERTSHAIGAGGTLDLSFIPSRIGNTRIILRLRRPWETEVAETREVEIEVYEPVVR